MMSARWLPRQFRPVRSRGPREKMRRARHTLDVPARAAWRNCLKSRSKPDQHNDLDQPQSAAPADSLSLSRRHFSLASLTSLAAASSVLAACTTTGTETPQNKPQVAPPPVARNPRPIRVGLALGGGAARGFAHIGVIKALEARNIQVDLITGTSAGSVVAALYASGLNGFAINKLALTMDEASISDWAMPFRTRGILQGIALQNFLNTTLHDRPIEKMAKPLGVVSTDLQTGQPILFQRGNTGIAVRASCSIPSIFEPVKIGGHEYVDGGLVSPVPASFAKKMGADFVIAVDISSRPETASTLSQFDVLMQTFTIMGQSIKTYELEKYADVVIRPSLNAMSSSDFTQRNAAILAGEEAGARAAAEIERKLAAARAA
ncbi:patatin-like phospholipase family protein [Paraburkholderia tropica]|uniref:patatin-like phospholipase family protein n=1 Tax=Paraburkholderia tropica TaxID=92647 RepID=UPI0038BCDC25